MDSNLLDKRFWCRQFGTAGYCLVFAILNAANCADADDGVCKQSINSLGPNDGDCRRLLVVKEAR